MGVSPCIMRVGILQVDGKLPNLALMKICAYHERMGDTVSWYDGALFNDNYDKIYASKIFAFSPMPELPKDKSVIGGTGIDFYNKLPSEIENETPSYTLYPNCDYHLGFSMKGCRFSCSFCCVPKKEGKPYKYSSIDGILINPPVSTDCFKSQRYLSDVNLKQDTNYFCACNIFQQIMYEL